jgi:diguanylate cyclase (GGDEF)-like protein
MFMTILLLTVFAINFQTSTESVHEQLYEDAKNTATSLSLSLGSAGGDESVMSTMINANFDSGHYRSISLYDVDDELIYERKSDKDAIEVPAWFRDAIVLDIPIASAQVSAGWSPVGILNVQSDNSYAYIHLYDTFLSLIILFVSLAVVGLSLLSLLLHLMLKPLRNIRKQAEAIIDNEFIIEEKVPYTTEFKRVTQTMNTMVYKVQEIFEKGNEALRNNQKLNYEDPVTMLYNRRYLDLKLPGLIAEDNENNGGAIMLVAFHGAQVANKHLGHQKADELFLTLATIFQEYTANFANKLIARVNGTEFILLLPDATSTMSQDIANHICSSIEGILMNLELSTKEVGLNIGICRYTKGMSKADVLSKSDYALSQANLNNLGNVYLYEERDNNVLGKEEWRSIINNAIDKNYLKLSFWPVLNTKTKVFSQKVMTFGIEDDEENFYSYGSFVAPAIGIKCIDALYISALKKLFTSSKDKLHHNSCSIRLSSELLKTVSMHENLEKLFKEYGEGLDFEMTFECSDNLVLQNIELVKTYISLFHKYGFSFGINQFSGESKDFNYLKKLNPKFIKADCTFLLDQSAEGMASIQVVTDALGIDLIATGVKDSNDLVKLQQMHIHTIQGPLAEKL